MLTDAEARRLACEWHGGRDSALYELCSTGAITDDTAHEITANIIPRIESVEDSDLVAGEVGELAFLRDYVYEHGPRGPVDGWSTLVW
jgi:hypothetical protein